MIAYIYFGVMLVTWAGAWAWSVYERVVSGAHSGFGYPVFMLGFVWPIALPVGLVILVLMYLDRAVVDYFTRLAND
jgi:hypothetical protein